MDEDEDRIRKLVDDIYDDDSDTADPDWVPPDEARAPGLDDLIAGMESDDEGGEDAPHRLGNRTGEGRPDSNGDPGAAVQPRRVLIQGVPHPYYPPPQGNLNKILSCGFQHSKDNFNTDLTVYNFAQ